MNRTWLAACACLTTIPGLADEPTASQPGVRPRGVAVGVANAAAPEEAPPARVGDGVPAKFSSAEKWSLAGYNNNEVVYTIIVTNEDTRILHCTTLMNGWYFEDGKKLSISDRQSTTVFPNEPTQVGNWMDLDQASGVTYTVKCRPI